MLVSRMSLDLDTPRHLSESVAITMHCATLALERCVMPFYVELDQSLEMHSHLQFL